MLHVVSIWLLVAGFFGAGVFNAIGTAATRRDFVSWGYPPWWCRVTGGLEMAVALLIALPASRGAGLIMGAVIIAAAIATVVLKRGFTHLVPLSVFAVLLALVEISS